MAFFCTYFQKTLSRLQYKQINHKAFFDTSNRASSIASSEISFYKLCFSLYLLPNQENFSHQKSLFYNSKCLRERSLMTSLVFWPFLTYLPTFSYFITSLFWAILDPLPTVIWDVINERSLKRGCENA